MVKSPSAAEIVRHRFGAHLLGCGTITASNARRLSASCIHLGGLFAPGFPDAGMVTEATCCLSINNGANAKVRAKAV